MWQIQTIFYFFLGAFALSTISTWWLVQRGGQIGMDQPDSHRKTHERPISRLGGGALFLTLALGFLALAVRLPEFLNDWAAVMAANAIIFSIGFLDDLNPLGAKIKLLGQVGAALILYSFGVSIDVLSNPLGEGSIMLGWWSLPVTVLWLIAIPNIINLIDGMDGLATGFGLFLCLTLAFVGHFALRPDVVLVSMVMVGALAGFLIFNFPPAKIFLGDGGAYLIGFFVASTSLMSSNKGSIIASLLVILVALGIPILDTAFAILRRAIRGMPIFRADAEHIHHRLITLGYSKAQALVALYCVCLVLSLAGISLLINRGLALPVVGSLGFLLAAGAARYLGYIRSWKGMRQQFASAIERRKQREYLIAHGTLLELEVERCQTAEEFSQILLAALSRLDLTTKESPDRSPLEIPCLNGSCILLHRLQNPALGEEWRFRSEILEPVMSRALERWKVIPGLEIHPQPSPRKGLAVPVVSVS
jgi:UDP-GlcNAc:undecaprenyl-phosphate/decaprenyl-phosphate GlcNAc-1-phosphate transferase